MKKRLQVPDLTLEFHQLVALAAWHGAPRWPVACMPVAPECFSLYQS